MNLSFTVNNAEVKLDVSPQQTLLSVLRNRLGLMGTKPGCEVGDCGACSVILDGELARACLIKANQLEGTSVTTIEGIHDEEGGPNDLQQAFIEFGATQCGYCTPGMIIAAEALLNRTLQPTRQEIRQHLEKNLCRCTGYQQIFEAVEHTAELRRNKETR